jgi:hypothetical protein
MKTKMFLAAGLFFLLTSFTTNSNFHKLTKRSTVHIGFFAIAPNEYDAYGDETGHVTAIYHADINDNDYALVYSWSGTYVNNNINVSFKTSPTSGTLTFNGACYDE